MSPRDPSHVRSLALSLYLVGNIELASAVVTNTLLRQLGSPVENEKGQETSLYRIWTTNARSLGQDQVLTMLREYAVPSPPTPLPTPLPTPTMAVALVIVTEVVAVLIYRKPQGWCCTRG